ncbi:uncharacterized protein CTHT_0060260 [Thermochaetoides thermophila DSM 1495]|uniref:RRM domain-containing protein n=1 Tax=Chaetomium thermophilum (strain DSM 1495 / CBS 144.50 / IMI 039719) TaxID=759272 RepID=G0SEZ7_CHATD|nr:hypothetical protein CTHT_0060260 [Thermochaetoides thermophila DSM 1495]EGS18013.1 hypothetical protein CTHT_0060260 [Thermochaetoides thermophila DSM 1495]
MSYPGPPGVSKPSHPSLPPRPPVVKLPGFKPAFSPAPAATASPAPPVPPTVSAPGYTAPAPSYPGYPPVAAPPSYGVPPTATPYAGPAAVPPAAGRGAGYGPVAPTTTPFNYPATTPYTQAPSYYGASAATTNGYGAHAMRNAYHHHNNPGADSADYDPELAAQIAQWQSAYMPKDPDDPNNKAGAGATGAQKGAAGAQASSGPQIPDPALAAQAAAAGTEPGGKKKTVVREGGGKKWTDDTLLEWDPSHFRLFVGNLAGETTDESLLKAFSRWKSVQKAKVIRDKRTNKSKGFGFVSFSDPDDFFQAAKEMNGKYIQSHPVVVKKAKTEIKPVVMKDDKKGNKKDKKGGAEQHASGSGMGGAHHEATAYHPHLGPIKPAGVTKPGQKTKGGLKLLG